MNLRALKEYQLDHVLIFPFKSPWQRLYSEADGYGYRVFTIAPSHVLATSEDPQKPRSPSLYRFNFDDEGLTWVFYFR